MFVNLNIKGEKKYSVQNPHIAQTNKHNAAYEKKLPCNRKWSKERKNHKKKNATQISS